MRVRRFLHFLLFFIAGLLVWRVVETWRRPLDGPRLAAQPNAVEEKPLPAMPSLSPQMGKRYADIIADKDLFTPSRSRAAVEVKPAASVPPPSHLKLVGVLLARGREEAFFADSTQGGKVVRVRKGEALGSYKLIGVAPLQATLTMGQDGNEVSLPLLVLDSNTAVQGQRLMPAVMRGNQGRPGQARQVQQPPPAPGRPGGEGQPTNEAHAIRQNIQQLQQRLRQIRKQAARDGAAEDEEEEDSGEDEEEGEEEEE